MGARIIDGKAVAESVKAGLRGRIQALASKGRPPCLAVVLVGDNPASVSYVTSKERDCEELGIRSLDIRLPGTLTKEGLAVRVRELNADPAVDGILVQLPLPGGLRERDVIAEISPEKDVDGLTPLNAGRLAVGEECFYPCTPHGIVKLVEATGIALSGADVTVVGRSNLVGKPLANLLVRKEFNATVTLCHTGTRNLAAHCRGADIVVACAGKRGLVTAEMVKPGACVIDVGVNRVPDASKKKGYRIEGDVDFESVSAVAGWITPPTGGVGPMTRAMLYVNAVRAAEIAAAAREPAGPR
jgi:methylenetetrahydrofolate dehydrogenase (NADP+) / methenyltetrahydrofolate cyclohydrolase